MKILLKSVTLTALVMALAVSTNAQQRFNNNPDRPRTDRQAQMYKMRANQGVQHQRLVAILDLSAEQQEQIEEIRLNGQKGMLPLRNNLQEKNARLTTLTTSDEYNEKAVNELIAEISELRGAMMIMQNNNRQQIRELLTESQRVKFDTFHVNHPRQPHQRGFNK